MHAAFPRECPYPHVAGATEPVNIGQFQGNTPGSHFATDSTIQEFAARHPRRDAPMLSAPWVNQEELFARPSFDSPPVLGLTVIHLSAALVALLFTVTGLARTSLRAARHTLIALPGQSLGRELRRAAPG